ncbi:MAG: hypothetical protein L6R45_14550 [Anaerolineae bacterium]|nr:hypothetical protein [Anaerolineae bacterium]
MKLPLLSLQFCRPGLSFVIALLLFMTLLMPVAVQAIGPGTGGSKIRVSDERVGPYILLVATSPLPVTVGQMSVWVRVTDIHTNQLRRDAIVTIRATPREGGETLMAEASHKNAGNDYDYVAHFEVQSTGQWDVTVSVTGEPGQAEVAFTETVTQGLSLGLLLSLAIPFIVLAIVVGIYLWRRSAAGAQDS